MDRTRAVWTSCATRSVVEPLFQGNQTRLQLGRELFRLSQARLQLKHQLLQLGQALLLRPDQRAHGYRCCGPIVGAQTRRNQFVAHLINLPQFQAGVYRQYGQLTPFA